MALTNDLPVRRLSLAKISVKSVAGMQEKQIMTELSIKLIDGSLVEGSTVRVSVDAAKDCLKYDVTPGILKKRRVKD